MSRNVSHRGTVAERSIYARTIKSSCLRSIKRQSGNIVLIAALAALPILLYAIASTSMEFVILASPSLLALSTMLAKFRYLLKLVACLLAPPMPSSIAKALGKTGASRATLSAALSASTSGGRAKPVYHIKFALSFDGLEEVWTFKHADLSLCKTVFWSGLCYLLALAKQRGVDLSLTQEFGDYWEQPSDV